MGVFRSALVLSLAVAAPFWSGCGSTPDTTAAYTASESVSEISGSVIGGAVNFSSSTQSSAMFKEAGDRTASGGSTTSGSSVCPSMAHASCAGQTIKLTYANCTAASGTGEKWTGIDQFVFSSGTCTNTPEQSSVTFVRGYPSGMSQTDSTARTITSDTLTTSGWETPIAGGGTTFVIDPVAGTRSIQVNGVHLVATQVLQKGSHQETVTIWDRTVNASQPFVFNQSSQTVSSGSLTVQHNLAKYTATVQILTPLQFQAGTCNPISGSIFSTWAGSQTGSETLTYTGVDKADLVDSSGNRTSVTLAHCL